MSLLKRKLIALAVTVVLAGASGALALYIYAQRTVSCVHSVLSALETFNDREGAFSTLAQLRDKCGSACFVTTTHECDRDLCGVEFGFDNRWLSHLHVAPASKVTGFIGVVGDRLDHYSVEFDVDAEGREYTAIAQLSSGLPAPTGFTQGRWTTRSALFGNLPTAASVEDRRCALDLNLRCFTGYANCRALRDIAPCTHLRAMEAQQHRLD